MLLDTIGAMVAGSAQPENRRLAAAMQERRSRAGATLIGPRRAGGPAAGHVRQRHRGRRARGGRGQPSRWRASRDPRGAGRPRGGGGHRGRRAAAAREPSSPATRSAPGSASATTPKPNVHSHGTWGTIGTAVAVAKLAGLDAAGVRSVINLSASMSPANTWTTALEGVTIRNAYPGRSGLEGILAVDLHRAGFTGLPDAPSDVYGTILADRFEPARALDGLGGPLRIQQNYFKLYACCRYNHFALDALLRDGAGRRGPPRRRGAGGRHHDPVRPAHGRHRAGLDAGRQVLNPIRGGRRARAGARGRLGVRGARARRPADPDPRGPSRGAGGPGDVAPARRSPTARVEVALKDGRALTGVDQRGARRLRGSGAGRGGRGEVRRAGLGAARSTGARGRWSASSGRPRSSRTCAT